MARRRTPTLSGRAAQGSAPPSARWPQSAIGSRLDIAATKRTLTSRGEGRLRQRDPLQALRRGNGIGNPGRARAADTPKGWGGRDDEGLELQALP